MKKRRPTGDSAKGGRAAAAIARSKEHKQPLARYGKAYRQYLQESTSEIKSLERVRGW